MLSYRIEQGFIVTNPWLVYYAVFESTAGDDCDKEAAFVLGKENKAIEGKH